VGYKAGSPSAGGGREVRRRRAPNGLVFLALLGAADQQFFLDLLRGLADGRLDLVGQVLVVLEELADVVAALADALI
jgi:hypothetical protein